MTLHSKGIIRDALSLLGYLFKRVVVVSSMVFFLFHKPHRQYEDRLRVQPLVFAANAKGGNSRTQCTAACASSARRTPIGNRSRATHIQYLAVLT